MLMASHVVLLGSVVFCRSVPLPQPGVTVFIIYFLNTVVVGGVL